MGLPAVLSECSGLEPRREQPERNWHRAWVAALVPRRGRQDEGEGDPLKRRGLPLSLHLTPWALHGIFSLGALRKIPTQSSAALWVWNGQ